MLTRNYQRIHASEWITNDLTAVDYLGGERVAVDAVSQSRYGKRSRDIDLPANFVDAREIAATLVSRWKDPLLLLQVNLNPLFETDAIAGLMLGAFPHTVVQTDIPTAPGNWLVLNRTVIFKVEAEVINCSVRLMLISPSVFGIS